MAEKLTICDLHVSNPKKSKMLQPENSDILSLTINALNPEISDDKITSLELQVQGTSKTGSY